MDSSPSKRRRTSRSTSFPIDAPTTPSRIPVRKDGATTPRSRRPSFASPTKASIARHNPQLLARTPPRATSNGSRGRDLDEVFAIALGEVRPSIEGNDNGTEGSSTQEYELPEDHPLNTQTQKSTRSLSAKPRRLSRSPFKQSPTKAFQEIVDSGDLDSINPFAKKTVLRRSPVGAAQVEPVLQESPALLRREENNPFQRNGLSSPVRTSPARRAPMRRSPDVREQQIVDDNANPFSKRGGLRRSPVVSQEESVQQENINPFQKRGGLRRSPISSQPLESLSQTNNQLELSSTLIEPPPMRTSLPPREVSPVVVSEVPQLPVSLTQDNASQQSLDGILSTHPILSDPIFSQAVEDALRTSPSETRSSPIRLHTTQLSRLELEAADSPSLSQAIDAALLSSPLRPQATSQALHAAAAESPLRDLSLSQALGTTRTKSLISKKQSRDAATVSQNSQPVDITLRVDSPAETREQSRSVEQPILGHATTRSMSPFQIPHVKPAEPRSFLRSPARRPRTASPRASQVVRSSQPTVVRSQARLSQLEEPKLPPTPTQLGIPDPIVTTPPTGIHDTPSKRSRRRKEKLKSSPLKPRDPPPVEPSKNAEAGPPSKLKDKNGVGPRRRSARFFIPEDPHAAKKKERDELLKELQQLQTDLVITNQEHERLRSHYATKQSIPAAPKNPEQLLDVLRRSMIPEPATKSETKPISIFKSIGSFLPFSSRRKQTSLVDIKKPIPSHLPIKLDDPLPYLQAFSPLVFTSNITLLAPEKYADESIVNEERPILQRHFINASHPSGIFNAQLGMTVDSSLLSIISLDIIKLNASAENELGKFIRQRCEEENILGQDIGVVCWAMGRWVEASILRARFWCSIKNEFGTQEARTRSLQRKKKRKHAKLGESASADEDEQGNSPAWTKRQLLPHIGRSAMELIAPDVELRFEWKISFDWTGEIESLISANARVPENCKRRRASRKL
ncbi:hypothetical protein B0O99DRAFT_24675 [Bisporella sp. PMI_857]|nr:hypothetical protein B0O99DRAFT_24675 [Bisporella sp. PMI_857]